MPRRNLKFSQHEYYHIYNRGAGKHNLFIEDDNYLYVLQKTKKLICELCLTVIAYCLMPNHYHFLIRQDGQMSAGELPKRVFGGYSRAVYKRYGWSGTLFEGRFRARHVDSDSYLRHLCRYIHANPVKDGLAFSPEAWPYSNYQEWIGLRDGTLVDRAFVVEMFGSSDAYEQFVREYLITRVVADELKYLEW